MLRDIFPYDEIDDFMLSKGFRQSSAFTCGLRYYENDDIVIQLETNWVPGDDKIKELTKSNFETVALNYSKTLLLDKWGRTAGKSLNSFDDLVKYVNDILTFKFYNLEVYNTSFKVTSSIIEKGLIPLGFTFLGCDFLTDYQVCYFKKNSLKIKVIIVDCEINENNKNEFGCSNVPTLVLVNKESYPHEYDEQEITQWFNDCFTEWTSMSRYKNELRNEITMPPKQGRGYIWPSLKRECYNKFNKFSIMGNFSEPNPCTGACHEHIIKAMPELEELTKLHLRNDIGLPSNFVSNGMFYIKQQFKDSLKQQMLITDEIADEFLKCKDKNDFIDLVNKHDILNHLKTIAEKWITYLEQLNGNYYMRDNLEYDLMHGTYTKDGTDIGRW